MRATSSPVARNAAPSRTRQGCRASRTLTVWRCLCLLAAITACAALTGLLWWLPPLLQAVGVLALWLVAVCVVVAGWRDSEHGYGRR